MLENLRKILIVMFAAVSIAGSSPENLFAADDHDHDTEAVETENGHEEGSDGGMALKKDLALWSLVTFLVFILVLRVFAWGPLVQGLDKRESNIRTQIAQAEAARQKAEQMLKEHQQKLEAVQDEVKAIIEEAKRDADHTKNDIIATAQREAQATKERAIFEIDRARDQALKELFDTMATQVAEATEHVIGRSLGGDDQQRLIDEALAQFASSSQS